METLREIEDRIESAGKLGQIVRTMRTLATVNIRRYRAAVESLRRYTASLRLAVGVVLDRCEIPPPAVDPRAPFGAVLLSSDQGLCGPFNERLLAFALDDARARRASRAERVWLASGGRGRERLEAAGEKIIHAQDAPTSPAGILDRVQDLLIALVEAHASGRFSRAVVYYNEHKSGAEFREAVLELIPFDPARAIAAPATDGEGEVGNGDRRDADPEEGEDAPRFRTLPLLEGTVGDALPRLVEEWYFSELYRAFAESLASENASRLVSMEGAERNIRDRIAELKARHRERRQQEITAELMDVIGGTEALTPP
ncbi:MAG: F0F1 ATP synthase subunit gamma [Planctomycetes bacterium]|nr:F0F1 ATP synthase subunit gamma [Planctomycetota bacterium]